MRALRRDERDGDVAGEEAALAPPRAAHPLRPGARAEVRRFFPAGAARDGAGHREGAGPRADGRPPEPMGAAAAAGLPDTPLSGPLTPPGRISRTRARAAEAQVCGGGRVAGGSRAEGGLPVFGRRGRASPGPAGPGPERSAGRRRRAGCGPSAVPAVPAAPSLRARGTCRAF